MQCDVGDLVRLKYEFKNESGALADPDALMLYYITPDATMHYHAYTYGEASPATEIMYPLGSTDNKIAIRLAPRRIAMSMRSVRLYLSSTGSSAGGSLAVGLYSSVAGVPSELVTAGTAITEAAVKAGGSGWYSSTLSSALAANTEYWIVLEFTATAGEIINVYGSQAIHRTYAWWYATAWATYPWSLAYQLEVSTMGTTVTITRDSVGLYHRDVDVDQAGEWRWRWEATGSGQGVSEGSFTAKPSVIP